jgi:hypothetical protein
MMLLCESRLRLCRPSVRGTISSFPGRLAQRSYSEFDLNQPRSGSGSIACFHIRSVALECRALKRVREEMGLPNVTLMIPFRHRTKEAEYVLHGWKICSCKPIEVSPDAVLS